MQIKLRLKKGERVARVGPYERYPVDEDGLAITDEETLAAWRVERGIIRRWQDQNGYTKGPSSMAHY